MKTIPDHAPTQLLAFLTDHAIDAEFIEPGVPMPTVPAAAAAIGVREEQVLKTLVFVGDEDCYVVVVANGTRRINRAQLAEVSSLSRPRTASPEAVLTVTGYPAGGVSPLGLPAGLPVIVDERVAALSFAFAGGGTDDLLLRLKPADVIRFTHAKVARIVDET
jgi:Cys-tRNA(Pro) deacylase